MNHFSHLQEVKIYLKNYILCIILLVSVSSKSIGQTKDSNPNQYILTESWEIGTDLLWLINKNQLPPSNIFVRRNLETKKGTRHAWRLRLGADVSVLDSINVNDSFDNEINQTYLILQLGHEWQYQVIENALFYFGADLSFAFDRTYILQDRSVLVPSAAGPVRFKETNTIYTPGLSGIAGVRYHPQPWIALSLESSLITRYRVKRNPFNTTSVLDAPPDAPIGTFGFEDSETFLLRIIPIAFINVSFHF